MSGTGYTEPMDVRTTEAAEDEFLKLPLRMRARVLLVYERLERWPEVSGHKALKADWAGFSSLRTGDYRVIFHLLPEPDDPQFIEVVRVAHRRDVYD